MSHKVTFDGPNKLMLITSGTSTVSVEADIYSAWKQFALTGSNLQYGAALRTVGGDSIGASLEVGAYFFVQNEDGWRIRPPEHHGEVVMVGNLYPENSSIPLLTSTLGAYTMMVTIERSSLTQVSAAGEAVGVDIEAIKKKVNLSTALLLSRK